LQWNFFIDFFYYSTLEIGISILLSLSLLSTTETINDKFNVGLTWAFIVMELAFLIFFVYFMYAPWH
jgi:hypothetical protein